MEINTYTDYANRYNCSLATAIHDRDWPLNREECINAFTKEAGRAPTEAEITEMRPDQQPVINEWQEEQRLIATYY